MNTLFIGQTLIELPLVNSTNSYAMDLIQKSEVVEGTIIHALNQVDGRGQRGNIWHSEAGKNLTISVILKPSFLPAHRQFDLNKVISLAVFDFIGSKIPALKEQCKIKWPNDIYIGDKKIGGILIENSLKGNQISWAIIGIGLNINQETFHPSIPNPVSLKQLSNITHQLNELLEELCLFIEARYLQLKNNSTATLNADYLSVLFRYKQFSNYIYNNESIYAKMIGVSDQGRLIIEKEDGTLTSCDFKEISFVL